MLPISTEQKSSSTKRPFSTRVWTEGTLIYTRAGLGALIFWLSWGDFAWALKERSVALVLQVLLKKYSASDLLVSLLLVSVPNLIAMICTPIVSYKSDRHRGRWGRRIPFLLVPTPIGVFAMVGLAFSPFVGGYLHATFGGLSPGKNMLILALLGIFWVMFSFTSQISNAVFGGLINDVVPRELLGRFFGAFRALSLIAGMIFTYWIFAKAETAYVWIFLGMGVIYGGGFLSMCLKVKEGEYPPPTESSGPGGVMAFFFASGSYFKECFSNSFFIWYYAALGLSFLAFVPINTYSLFYALDLHMPGATYGKSIAVSYLISLILTYPLGILADRVHPLRAGIAMLVIYMLATFGAGWLVHDSKGFAVAFVVFTVTSGAWMTVTASIAQKLLPRNNFAQIASAAAVILCAANIAVPPVIGTFLDHHNHNYRYTFYISGGIAAAALMASIVLHAKFMRLGGPKNFIAPD